MPQDLHREFDASIPYIVSRVMTGYVEEVLSATDTVIITGDIVMEGMEVSYLSRSYIYSRFNAVIHNVGEKAWTGAVGAIVSNF